MGLHLSFPTEQSGVPSHRDGGNIHPLPCLMPQFPLAVGQTPPQGLILLPAASSLPSLTLNGLSGKVRCHIPWGVLAVTLPCASVSPVRHLGAPGLIPTKLWGSSPFYFP